MIPTVSISGAEWLPLSAQYQYDENIEIPSNYFIWHDGYAGFEHPAFKNSIDFSINRNTAFYLPSAKNLFSFIKSVGIDDVTIGSYVIIGINGGSSFNNEYEYVTSSESSLFLNPISSDNCFFRFIINEDNTFSLFCDNGLFVTVGTKNPFDLTMREKLPEGDNYRQKFNWYEYNDKIYFTTKIINPIDSNKMDERFWSFSKVGPDKGKLKANGIVSFNDYPDTIDNNYLFDVYGFILTYSPNGLITEHSWIRYYSEFKDKFHNKDAEIQDQKSSPAIFVGHLFDLPYNTKIDATKQTMEMNFMNLKNAMTSEYEFRVKPKII